MKIVVFDIEEWECAAFHPLEAKHDITFVRTPLTVNNAAQYSDAQIISVFIYSAVTADILALMPRLQLIATRSTGYDHIDVGTCRERGIHVANVPSYGKNTVAEHVFALLLTISHRMEEAVDRTRKGDFSSRGLQGFDLQGRTLGVIGTGDIGRETVRIARGFGMSVLAYDIAPDAGAADALGFTYVALDQLLKQSDVITLHVPSNADTFHMIGAAEFALMKQGVVLINTARGEVIDVRELARALAERKVAAAGLDVLTNEPVIREEAELLRSVYEEKHDLRDLLADEVLIRMRNVIVTPHSAFNTREAVGRILQTTVGNIRSFTGGKPQHTVSPQEINC